MPWGRCDGGQDAAFTESVIAECFQEFQQTTKTMSPGRLPSSTTLLPDERKQRNSAISVW
jgi:hypothetical protein